MLVWFLIHKSDQNILSFLCFINMKIFEFKTFFDICKPLKKRPKMYDEDSFKFLICKKIAQLVKLINHLSLQIAERQHEIESETQLFENEYNENIKKCEEEINFIRNSFNLIEEDCINDMKKRFDHQYNQTFEDFENLSVSAQSEIKETEVSIQHSVAKFTEIIQIINQNIDSNLKQLDELIESKKQEFQRQVIQLNDQHQKELILLDKESDEKLNQLESQTSKKLDALDRDFNRSLSNLKLKFGQTETTILNNPSEKVHFQQIFENLEKVKKSVMNSKEEIVFLISNTKAILNEQIARKNKFCEDLKNEEKLGDDQNAQKHIENSNEEDQKYQEFMKASQIKMKELSDLLFSRQKEFNDLIESNKEEIESQKLLNNLSEKKKNDTFDAIQTENEQEIFQKTQDIDNQKKKFQDSSEKIQNDIQNLLNDIQTQQDEFRKVTETHEKEKILLINSQNSAIDDLKKLYQEEIDSLNERNRKAFEKLNTNKLIEENRQIYNELCSQRAELCNERDFVDDPEVNNLRNQFISEKLKIQEELENEIKKATEEEKDRLENVLENHRKTVFELNTKIAENYDQRLWKEKEYFKNKDYEIEINESYRLKVEYLENQLNQEDQNTSKNTTKNVENLENVGLGGESVESLEKAKKANLERIEAEKKMIIDDFISQQKEEEDHYLRRLADINYIQPKSEFDQIRNEFQTRIKKHELVLLDLQNQFNGFQSKDGHLNDYDKVKATFDYEENELRNALNKNRAECNILIQKELQTTKKMKDQITSEIKDFINKVKKVASAAKRHNQHSTVAIEDANNKNKEELDTLQKKVASAITRLVKHYSKKKEKMIKKHQKLTNHLNQEIEALSSQIKSFETDQIPNSKLEKDRLDKKSQDTEANIIQELEMLRANCEKKLNDLEIQIQDMNDHLLQLKTDIENHKSREDELNIIERLETQLKIKEQHIKDMTQDISDYKKRLVQQEGVYNSHFGVTPAVAVLRPSTAAIPIPINKRMKQRPGSAAVTIRSTSFLKNRSKKIEMR
ncbi:hypothetical protein TRFO_14002 [Tritrichomonas foetus]|uniref:Uncharacterized protein n=1 Tax=Tritrichomonas foetus TaxID=1144522 RepID=A0A1J4KWT9_9EUKA|nr:hypothetical protein TRFO_14002 [Tritrichomonas foetus]|eukprot:OHT15634.1 hypothetical protein TRFO_14002 [Tritrichomonas foetus]